MKARSLRLRKVLSPPLSFPRALWKYRGLMTLAIETSCDDTSVAIVEKEDHNGQPTAKLHFHEKVTSNNAAYRGVHPLVSLQSHQENLAILVSRAMEHLPAKRLPDFISVTRGPGMRSNLFTGLDTAKGLAVAWQKPLVGVHHMQAHALTPRLVHALYPGPSSQETRELAPRFPFLSVLASGGHTLLIYSASLTDHRIVAGTNDIAIGECLDKIARVILPEEVLHTSKSTMYGALLENFALTTNSGTCHGTQKSSESFSAVHSARSYLEQYGQHYGWYSRPLNNEEAKRKNITKWGWGLDSPLTRSAGGTKISTLDMSFSGITTFVERIMKYGMDTDSRKLNKAERDSTDVSVDERRDLARETMRATFEHIASRVVLALESLSDITPTKPALVMAGGVAANSFLRHILANTLVTHGYPDIALHFPPPKFCTDNAAMIGWTGIEMFEDGHTDPLSIRAVRKWPLNRLRDPEEDG